MDRANGWAGPEDDDERASYGARGDDAITIARLAAMDPAAYDRVRQAEAERLGIRVGTLDNMVRAARDEAKAETSSTRRVVLPEVEPWPVPVDPAELLADLAAAVRRHVVLSRVAADTVVLWIAHTWVHERFQHTPRLGITSPVKRCGKSTLLEVLRATCHRPVKADGISASGVFRTVEALRPLSLLIDEADSFLADNEELRGVLNSGFEASGVVIRVVEQDGEHQPVMFPTFAPVALAAIGNLPDTLGDRALPLRLQRKATSERVEKLRQGENRRKLGDLARKLARWAQDAGPRLPADPEVPDALNDREGDISVPLLAIADHAGGDWPGRARKALLGLFGARAKAEGDTEAGTLLLTDLRLMFLGLSATRLPSADICKRLGEMDDRPWPEWKAGKPITQRQLAVVLSPFGVRPGNMRSPGPGGGEVVVRGYERAAFEEVWSRYLPQDTPSPPRGGFGTATAATSQEYQGKAGANGCATEDGCSASQTGRKQVGPNGCSGGSGSEGGSRGEEGIDAASDTDEYPYGGVI